MAEYDLHTILEVAAKSIVYQQISANLVPIKTKFQELRRKYKVDSDLSWLAIEKELDEQTRVQKLFNDAWAKDLLEILGETLCIKLKKIYDMFGTLLPFSPTQTSQPQVDKQQPITSAVPDGRNVTHTASTHSVQSSPNKNIKVAFVCAITDESEAVKSVFQHHNFSFELQVFEGRPVHVSTVDDAVVYLFTPAVAGLAPTANILSPFLRTYKPDYLLMTGVCGGNPKEVKRGDVVIANSALKSTPDKVIQQLDNTVTQVYDSKAIGPRPHMLPWLDLIVTECNQWLSQAYLSISRPLILGTKQNRIIWHIYEKTKENENTFITFKQLKDVINSPIEESVELSIKDRELLSLIVSLKVLNLVEEKDTQFRLTKGGREYAKTQSFHFMFSENPVDDGIVSPLPKVHVGTIAVADHVNSALPEEKWEDLSKHLAARKLMGIEMEAIALFNAAISHNEHPECDHPVIALFAKGVMDYAYKKDDAFKKYAAYASAGWALYFIRQYASKILNPPNKAN